MGRRPGELCCPYRVGSFPHTAPDAIMHLRSATLPHPVFVFRPPLSLAPVRSSPPVRFPREPICMHLLSHCSACQNCYCQIVPVVLQFPATSNCLSTSQNIAKYGFASSPAVFTAEAEMSTNEHRNCSSLAPKLQ